MSSLQYGNSTLSNVQALFKATFFRKVFRKMSFGYGEIIINRYVLCQSLDNSYLQFFRHKYDFPALIVKQLSIMVKASFTFIGANCKKDVYHLHIFDYERNFEEESYNTKQIR